MRRTEMGKVTSEISMSLDGFVTGPNVRVGNGMGDDGDRLHDWKFDAKTETDDAIVDETYASTGAVLIGKRMFRLFEDLDPEGIELRRTSFDRDTERHPPPIRRAEVTRAIPYFSPS
jgi:hypothetical protein